MGLLTAAGAISGGGSAVNQGLQTVQNAATLSILQRERDQMEMKREALNHAFATQRDTTAFERQKELGAAERQAQAERDQAHLGAQITVQGMHNAASDEQNKARIEVEKEQLAAQKAHYQATEAHQKNLEKLAEKQYGDEVREVRADNEGKQWAVMKSGAIKPLLVPGTNEPIIGVKGLSDRDKALAESYGKQAEGLRKAAELDPTLHPKADQAFQHQREILGEKTPATPQIDNPFVTNAAGSGTKTAPTGPVVKSVPAPSAETQAQMTQATTPTQANPSTSQSAPSPVPSFGPLEGLQGGAQETAKGLVSAATPYKPTASPITKETPQQAREQVSHAITPDEREVDEQRKASMQEAARELDERKQSSHAPKNMTHSLEEAVQGLPPVNLPKVSRPRPTLKDVKAYLEAEGKPTEKKIRKAYLEKYGTAPTQALYRALLNEAR